MIESRLILQALDTPWNALQVQGISDTLDKYGVEVVAVTDAAQDPQRQVSQLRALADQRVHVVFSVPIDPATQASAYKRVAEAGIKLVLMDNVPSPLYIANALRHRHLPLGSRAGVRK